MKSTYVIYDYTNQCWMERCFYVKHGEFMGQKEVVSFDVKENARKFSSLEEAQKHFEILPEWVQHKMKIGVLTPYGNFKKLEHIEIN